MAQEPIMKYYVLKEIEVPLTDIKRGDLFRVEADPNQLWVANEDAANPDAQAEPVVLVKSLSVDQMRLGITPDSLKPKTLKEKEDADT